MKNLKKVLTISIFALSMFILSSFGLPAKAASEQLAMNEETFENIIESMNSIDVGQKRVIDNEWIVECKKNNVIQPQSVYVDTKSDSRTWYVMKKKKRNKPALIISQSVTYRINDNTHTVSIRSYKTSADVKVNYVSATKAVGENYSKDDMPKFSTGYARYDVVNYWSGTGMIALSATVSATGSVDFAFDVVK